MSQVEEQAKVSQAMPAEFNAVTMTPLAAAPAVATPVVTTTVQDLADATEIKLCLSRTLLIKT